jgi:hypothetical protein
MSTSNTFKALLVEDQGGNTFSKKVVDRNISDLPENDLLIDVQSKVIPEMLERILKLNFAYKETQKTKQMR